MSVNRLVLVTLLTLVVLQLAHANPIASPKPDEGEREERNIGKVDRPNCPVVDRNNNCITDYSDPTSPKPDDGERKERNIGKVDKPNCEVVDRNGNCLTDYSDE
ncbi:unnamed protein product [Callosobruchus maculatus]|uniref:PPAF-2-like Clip domain-containing protein n=1 Tax=Callosobruchus maculatus TaxID=64391 RepID=A0A653D9X3_CALMS|nr:unnamed protein product [Callosobruchus maculatus]